MDTMKKTLTILLLLIAISSSLYAQHPDKDHYRRSSLCLVLLAHSDKQYADAMTRVFQNFPMPSRYNEHNVDVRVVRVSGKQSKTDIDRILRSNDIAKGIVSKWFNRDRLGYMNMDLIHERGGYGAFHDDYARAMNTVRGTAMLHDEGIELLQNTFVLVCDMDYIDKKKGFKIGAFAAALGSAALQGIAMYNEIEANNAITKGDYEKAKSKMNNATTFYGGAALANVGAAVLDDLGGFRVKIHSYLYKLRWDDYMTQAMFSNYWVDNETPRGEAERRRQNYDDLRIGLEYLGDYQEASGKTILLSWSNEDEVILDVCDRAVKKGIESLAKKYEIFRPRTPFYVEGTTLFSHIGTKEDVSRGKKYEIVQRSKDKKGNIKYKRLGVAVAHTIWNNKDVSFDRYFDNEHKGTGFSLQKGNLIEFAMQPGLQIREMK